MITLKYIDINNYVRIVSILAIEFMIDTNHLRRKNSHLQLKLHWRNVEMIVLVLLITNLNLRYAAVKVPCLAINAQATLGNEYWVGGWARCMPHIAALRTHRALQIKIKRLGNVSP